METRGRISDNGIRTGGRADMEFADTPDRETEALIKLLSDPDVEIVRGLAESLFKFSEARFHQVTSMFDQKQSPYPPALAIAHRRKTMAQFARWLNMPQAADDLETGLVLISAWGKPGPFRNKVSLVLDGYAAKIRERALDSRDPDRIIPDLCRYMFVEIGFKGNTDDYYNPENSFISSVLDRKLGIPISLSSILLLIARRLGVNVFPIGSPGYFLLSTQLDGQIRYIDCFGGGRILDRNSALELMSTNPPPGEDPLPIVNNREILARTLRNLDGVYSMLKDEERAAEVIELIESCEAD